MINLKRIDAPQSTITYDKNKIDAQTGNIYEAISIIAKRASQINAEIKHELEEKLGYDLFVNLPALVGEENAKKIEAMDPKKNPKWWR